MPASSPIPIIGIPCASYDVRPVPYPLIHGNNETYIRAVEQVGGAPLLVPLAQSEQALRAIFERLDGLLLAGGIDVDPARYGEEPHPQLGQVNREQDRVEFLLIEWARAAQMPIFAICRGIQVLNVAYGGTLWQDIPAQLESDHNHSASFQQNQRDLQSHQLKLLPDSRLVGYIGASELPINTMHHQAIKDLAPGLRAVGWSDDGLVEAVESPDEPWVVGVQCHPEELVKGADGRWGGVFAAFVAASAAWRTAQELIER
jgi:putative glutamine amidotransferase